MVPNLQNLTHLLLITTLAQTLHGIAIRPSPSTTDLATLTPHDLSPRQAGAAFLDGLFLGIVSGIDQTVAKEIQGKLGGHPPTCCDDDLPSCRINSGLSPNGHPWQACYQVGTETIFEFDVAAMKCIINLHYTQIDACIDIAGSVCGTGYGGGLMRGQMGYWGGNLKADQISDEDSKTFQAAAESMANVRIDYRAGDISLVLPSEDDGVLRIEMDFVGHQGKDC